MASLNTSKVDGNTVSASEWNQLAEINNLVINTGQTPSNGNLQQIGIASARYASAGQHFEDSSASANAYILSPVSPFRSPVSSTAGEDYFIGMRITFKTANANTGASTVNVNSLGVKSLKKSDGTTDVTTGDIPAGQYVTFIYNGTHFVKQNQTPATSTTQGIQALDPNKIIPISNNTTDAINDIDVGSGWFNFDDGSGQAYYSGGTGQLDVLFSAGGNGMLDAGTIANTTYHIFLIHNPTTLVSKILASTSVSSPTMPSGYTKKARIGSIIRASGAILAFEQFEKMFRLRGTKIMDRNQTTATTQTNFALTVPNGLSVLALSNVNMIYNSASVYNYLLFEPADYNGSAPSSTNFTMFGYAEGSYASSQSKDLITKTNTSREITHFATHATFILRVFAIGWIDYQLNY